jgi:predicted transposase/invertase (TIGR01784 family)
MQAEIARWQKDLYEQGVADGYKEGRREGLKEGQAEAIAKIVKNMAENGITIAEIAKITKLSMTEIEQILA